MEEIFPESSVTGTVGIICFHTKTIFIREHAGCRLSLQAWPTLSKNDFFENILVVILINNKERIQG